LVKRSRTQVVGLLAVLWLGASSSLARAEEALELVIGQALAEEGLVGATWSLVTPEGTTVGAAGLNDVSRNVRMSPHDRVQVGSVAKAFIAIGVLRLVTLGRVELDASVDRYLTGVPIVNPWAETSPLRVRHLLDHTGGLDDARMWQVFSLRATPDAPLRQGLVHPGGSVAVRHRPGERFSYSNSSYLLLGMLIEAVTGERYESWLAAELLVPLGMNRSTFEFVTQAGPDGDPTLAMGHFDPFTTSAAVPIHVRPASQFTTTAADMARFARFLMSDGRVEGRVLVDARLLRGMGTPVTTEAASAGLRNGYALGLVRRDRHGVLARCHFGNIGTFRAALCVFPEWQSAFFVAHNTDPEQANFARVDELLVRALGVPSPPARPKQPPSVDPAEWDGLYVVRPNRFAQFGYLDELMGVVRVRWDGDALQLLPLQGAVRILDPVGGALFRAPDRLEATHALLRSGDGAHIVTDGLRTLERVSPTAVYARWASAAAGLVALLFLLVLGAVRSVRALRRGEWCAEPLLWPTLCLALLIVAPALYLAQSFLAIGDPTPANVAIAMLTGLLPLALLLAAVHRLRAGAGGWMARLELLALAGALQWCAVLATWGMLPFVLWR
jgi:CubicO group peptidase (beta-lactamase class C family)